MKTKWLLPVILSLSLTGCWNAEEVTNRAIVLALGLDTGTKGRVLVSCQIPVVEELLPLQGGNPVAEKPFSVLSAEGESTFAAVPGLQNKTQRSLFFGQIKSIIIGKELAEKGLNPYFDSLNRHPLIAPQAFVMLSRGRAQDMLDEALWHKRMPANLLVSFFQSKGKRDMAFPQQLWEFLRNLASGTQDAYLPILDYDDEEQTFIIHGLGILQNDQLVGELTGHEARMFGLLSGQARNGYLSLPITGFGQVTFRRVRSVSRIRMTMAGEKHEFEIKMRITAFLSESTRRSVQLSQGDIARLQNLASRYLEREMTQTIKKLQSLNSDLLALGEEFRASHPAQWEQGDWAQAYPDANIRVSVNFTIQRFGTLR